MDKLEIDGRLAIVEPANAKKPIMVKLKFKKGNLSGIIQNNAVASQPDVIDLSADEILAIFPNNNPKPGKVYQCAVEPFTESFRAKKWGFSFLYRGMAEAEKAILAKALNAVYFKFIKPNKLGHLLPITIEIRPNDGKIQGYYRPEKRGIEHSICLCPTSFITDGVEGITRLLAHEIGHPLQTVYLPDSIKARWIKLYTTYNVIRDLTSDDLKSAYVDFHSTGDLPSSYRKNVEDDVKVIFNAILKYIKITYHLSLKDLDLIVAKKSNGIEKFWPSSKVKLSEMQTPISKYAGTNYQELLCESLAAYVMGEKLPKEILKLIKISIKSCQPK